MAWVTLSLNGYSKNPGSQVECHILAQFPDTLVLPADHDTRT
jgi:hypothetical protein